LGGTMCKRNERLGRYICIYTLGESYVIL